MTEHPTAEVVARATALDPLFLAAGEAIKAGDPNEAACAMQRYKQARQEFSDWLNDEQGQSTTEGAT